MSKAERLLKLVDAIEDGGLYTSDSLATLLNVTPRTIYRDIQHLRLQGWRILGGAGIGYLCSGRSNGKGYHTIATASEARP